MLTRFQIDNFKSLVDFSLPPEREKPLPKFVCLVGLNGSGKSSVLQALDFLAQLVVGDVGQWLLARRWDRTHLLSKASKKRTISFSMEFEGHFLGRLTWSGSYNVLEGRCVSEEIDFVPSKKRPSAKFPGASPVNLKYEKGVIRDAQGKKIEPAVDHVGSVFGKLKASALQKHDRFVLFLLHHYLSGVKSLELLSPSLMRMPSRDAVDVGAGGEKLAAFIAGLSSSEKRKLFEELSKFYPRLSKVGSRSGQYGWKRFFVNEVYSTEFESDARHINDGLLRIAAVVAQTVAEAGFMKEFLRSEGDSEDVGSVDQKEYEFVLLEEVENGINPELVERLVKYLLGVRQQVFVTTHSPLILNYLTDEQARDSVFLLFRKSSGATSAVRLFSLREARSRLGVMGPGEAFLDVGLEKLSEKLAV